MIKAKFIEMKNAYGIKELRVNYQSDKILYQSLIYSRNGTFKTSFSRTLNELSNGKVENIRDRLNNNPCSIKIEFIDEEENIVSNDCKNRFIVFSRELYEQSDNNLNKHNQEISLLTTNKDKKDELNILIKESVDLIKNSLEIKMKDAGLNIDKSINLLLEKNLDDLSINDCKKLVQEIKNVKEEDISKISLKNITQKAYDMIDDNSFVERANNYKNIFENRLKEELFDENFNDSNCMDFFNALEKNNFLNEDKKRGIIIKNNSYYDLEKIKSIFNEAISNVSRDPAVIAANKDLVKNMGSSAEAKKLQKEFTNNPQLINQLALGRRNIILIALKKQGFECDKYDEIIKETIKKYNIIIDEARKQQSNFEKAIEIYKNRFNPIFDIAIINRDESILGENIPLLSFKHNRNKDKELSENELREILSSGEKTALNIISFIVSYEANKNNNPIIVLDDLVETFDYANRHAFIEYINDLVKEKTSVIILTHNYEFYRTLGKRIPELVQLCAYSKDGKVSVEKNTKLNYNIESVFDINNVKQLIFAIPFLREVRNMCGENTELLDNCLHYKKETKNITLEEIEKIMPKNNYKIDQKDNYLKRLYLEANSVNEDNRYDIVPKAILAIACRLKIEEIIIGDRYELIESITRNQLSEIKKLYKEELTEEIISLIDKVQIATPEFIHCNSFMYEPLIDIDGKYLSELYEELKSINANKVWI